MLLLSYTAKKKVKMCEVQDFKSNSGKHFNKRRNRFYVTYAC